MSTDAGLQVGVERALHGKARKIEPGVHLELVVDAPVVFGIQGKLVGRNMALTYDGIEFEAVFFIVIGFSQTTCLGCEVVNDVLPAKLYGVVGCGGIVKIDTPSDILNA